MAGTRWLRTLLGSAAAFAVEAVPLAAEAEPGGLADFPAAASFGTGAPDPFGAAGRANLPGAPWRDQAALSGAASGQDLKLELTGSMTDLGRRPNDLRATFQFLGADRWEQNRVADTTLKLSAAEDRLRLTLREAQSDYAAATGYLQEELRRNKGSKIPGKERFLTTAERAGGAEMEQLDASLFKLDDLEVAAFGQHVRVDNAFESVELGRRRGGPAKDPFATPNQDAVKLGTSVRGGPLRVTVSETSAEPIEGSGPTQQRREALLAVDVATLRGSIGGLLASEALGFAPASVWIGFGQGELRNRGAAGALPDLTRDFSLGASWTWDGAHASASYWQSFYDTRLPGYSDYDWSGSGLDLAFGLYRATWSLDLALGATISNDLSTASRSTTSGYDGIASFTYKLDAWPDMTSLLYVGRFDEDYRAYGRSIQTTSVSASVAFDIAKFLIDAPPERRPTVQFLLEMDGTRLRDGFAGTETQALGPAVGMIFRTRF